MRWAGHVTRMRENIGSKTWSEEPAWKI